VSKRLLFVLALIALGGVLLLGPMQGVLDDPATIIDEGSMQATATSNAAPMPSPRVREIMDEAAPDAPALCIERTAAAPPMSAVPRSRPVPSDVDDATLVVHCVAKSDGRPIEGVRVSAAPRGTVFSSRLSSRPASQKGRSHEDPITARNGEVEIAVPSGTDLELWTSTDDESVSPAHTSVPPLVHEERRTLILELTVGEDAHYHGILLARDDRTPVANARVRAMRTQGWSTRYGPDPQGISDELAHVLSGGDGRFELTTCSWKHPYLRVDAQGFGPALVALTSTHESSEAAEVTLLDRAASIEASLRDARGAPLAGAKVVATAEGHRLFAESGWSATDSPPLLTLKWESKTSIDGRCRLDSLPARVPLSVTIFAPQVGASRADEILMSGGPPLVLAPGEVHVIDWQVGTSCRISGTLVDENAAPIPDHTLWLTPAQMNKNRYFVVKESATIEARATTNGDGQFSFTDVAAGMWWIGPAADAVESPGTGALAPFARVIEVPFGTREMTVDLAADRGLYIRGQVLDADGAITRTAYVSGVAEGSIMSWSAHMNDDGSFVLGPLMRGKYRLSALSFAQNGSSETVIVSAGEENVVLKLRRGGAIRGMVVDAKTGGGVRAQVLCSTRNIEQPDFKSIGTADDGTFEIDGLDPGEYDLTARLPDGRVARAREVSLHSGGRIEGLVLRAELAAKLHVRCERSSIDNRIQVWCDGALVGADGGMHKGSVSNHCVPKGKLTIVMGRLVDEKTQSRSIEIGAGEEKDVVFGDDP
jgi:hypothetical protein